MNDFTFCSPFREFGGVTPGENKSIWAICQVAGGSIGDGANRTLIVVVSIHKLVEQFGIDDQCDKDVSSWIWLLKNMTLVDVAISPRY
ncbi:hypothetical protein M404DRAFT_995601 [Pisolithus tinctorius Marx 270]|uniref:Uncharacterized protein n=1 Tax=Pisolithus tinctorius Marx 270 TaxID=870435 RepID=A0A0C3JML9_PISTI|nr:hypothetical protein M404DRAFT_995601 [Pisolithus tinctorius Marx 270]